jgi:transcriptional regulator with XRE-family HTH domain
MSTPDLNVQIGERLKAVRERERLSQTEFGERLGVVLRTYASYERGERSLSVEVLKALYEQFRVDPIWLLSGMGPDLGQGAASRQQLDLLVEIIVRVERRLTRSRRTLPPEKKARLIALLYQYFQAKAGVEDDYVEQALAFTAL